MLATGTTCIHVILSARAADLGGGNGGGGGGA